MNPTPLKLISLNIERDQHYDTVLPFLKTEKADVVCLQEVLDRDVARFERELSMSASFVPIATADTGRGTEELTVAGVRECTAIFTHFPRMEGGVSFYYGDEQHVPSKYDPLPVGRYYHGRGAFLWMRINAKGIPYTIGTTHFTWTPHGETTDVQREDLARFFYILDQFPDVIFCGDFNAPRGREIWGKLAARYRDNVPLSYTVSLDPDLHEVKNLPYLVDGLFSTPHYRVMDVRLVEGVSDHKAVVGMIEKVAS